MKKLLTFLFALTFLSVASQQTERTELEIESSLKNETTSFNPEFAKHLKDGKDLTMLSPGNWENRTGLAIYWWSEDMGYVYGTNTRPEEIFGQKFHVDGSYEIHGAYYWFRFAEGETGNVVFNIWEWDDEEGEPGNVIATRSIPLSDVESSITFEPDPDHANGPQPGAYYVEFDEPVEVTGDYVIGFDVSDLDDYVPYEYRLGAYSSLIGDGANLTLSWLNDENGWFSLESLGFSLDMAVFPLIGDVQLNSRTLTLIAEPEEGGAVEGGGVYDGGSVVTIEAFNNIGFYFEGWKDESDNIISNTPQYTFIMPAEDITLTASFVEYEATDDMQLIFNTELGSGTTVTLPLFGSVNVTVDWGDGNEDTFDTEGLKDHTYEAEGIYTVSISGSLTKFGNDWDGYDNAEKLLAVTSFGDLGIISLGGAFFNASNLTGVPQQLPENAIDLSRMFTGASSFNQDIGSWDVSNVDNMAQMFRNTPFNQDISGWKVGNVIYMTAMFYENTSFDQDIGGWDVSKVTDMRWMFFGASSFNHDISGWDVSNVNAMFSMFNGASSFNQDISNWDVSNVTTMHWMFHRASSFNQDIGSWDVSKVADMSWMFALSSFNKDISDWNVGNVTIMLGMFQDSDFNQDISDWDVSNVEDMRQMFYMASSFNQDISSWDVSNVEYMNFMFYGATLSPENYNKLLIKWSLLELEENVIFHGGNSKYDLGLPEDRRQYIIDEFGWTITDGGPTGNEVLSLMMYVEPVGAGVVEGEGFYDEGDDITIKAIANEGYEFVNWTGDTDHVGNVNSDETTVTMPNDDIELTANFIDSELISATIYPDIFEFEDFSDLDIMETTITWNDASDVERVFYIEGEAEHDLQYSIEDDDGVTATLIIDPDVAKKDGSVSTDGVIEFNKGDNAGFTITFTNPRWYVDIWVYDNSTNLSIEDAHVHILETGETDQTNDSGEAFFKLAAGTYNVDITAEGYAKVENYQITVEAGHDADNDFDIGMWPLYTLTLVAEPEEGGTVDGAGEYIKGEAVTITASVNEGFEFVNWTNELGGEESTSESFEYIMPADDVTLNANFSLIDYNINVTVSPVGAGNITGDDVSYNMGDEVTLEATPNAEFEFLNWRKDGSVISSDNPYIFTMPAEELNLTAGFIEEGTETYTVTLEVNDQNYGEVSGAGKYEEGESVTVVATPFDDYVFVSWTDEDDDIVSADASYTFDMPGENITLTANFEEIPTFTLTLIADPQAGGTVEGAGEYEEGEDITVTATPEDDYVFVNWSGDTDYIDDAESNSTTVTMPAYDITLTANFEEVTTGDYTLTLLADPVEGGNVYGAGDYDEGEIITVTATANEGYEFINWSGDTDYIDDIEAETATITMPAYNIALTANFESLYPHIVYIIDVDDIDVTYGTTEGEALAKLAEKTTIIDSDSEVHEVTLTWTIVDYNGEEAGNYTATGTFDLPEGVIQSDPLTDLEVTATVTVLDQPYIVGITPVNNLTVLYGTIEADAIDKLAETTTITDQYDVAYTVDLINWEIQDYDGDIAGDYNATGEFNLPDGVTQSDPETDLEVTTTVTVLEDGEDLPYIEEIDPVDNVQVPYGTEEVDAIKALAPSTTITASNDQNYTVSLSWTIENYNGVEPDNYPATGTFSLPAGVEQSDPETTLEVTATVTVLDLVYKISLFANPSDGGTVEGAGEYQEGETVTVTATANEDYRFVNWTGDTDYIDDAEAASASVTMPAYDITLFANFDEEQPKYYLTLNVNPSGAGTVSGSGSFTAGQSVSVSATANTGYEFENWTEGGSVLTSQASFSYIMPGNNVTLTANFKDVTLVEDISDTNISIFPNPTRNKFTVESNEMIKQIRLIDINGQVIIDKAVDELSYQVNVNELRTGMYFIQIHTDSGVVTERVQIAR